jgi:oxygen-independent coproporphyrinogen-3 oxidase
MYYKKEWIKEYLSKLKEEINDRYKGEKIRTLYIGGGTPTSLSIDELMILFDILKVFDLSELEEFTIECNIESLDKEKLILFKRNNVNRLSIGIQTFNLKYLELLNRNHSKMQVYEMLEFAKHIGFNNINLDLIYALPNQSINELDEDLDIFLRLKPEHISCYSLMIEPNTKMYINNIKPIDEDLDYEMYRFIESKLVGNGYNHYEISNYFKSDYESKHNLVYWNNEEYYGFGLGASSYVDDYRIDNTKNYTKYINKEFISNKEKVDLDSKIKYELILGFRKLNGINKNEFKSKYNIDITSIKNIDKLIKENKIIEDNERIYINNEWIYKSNEILMELL